jgi:general secretion pathway protein M
MSPMLQSLQVRWNSLAAREKASLRLVAVVLGLALLWWLLIAPALRTLGKAPAQHQSLDAQLQKVQLLQSQAEALRALPQVSQQTQLRMVELTLKPLGKDAQLQITGSQASVTLKQIPAEALADWLHQLRTQVRISPAEIRLSRNAMAPTWDGTVLFRFASSGAPAP